MGVAVCENVLVELMAWRAMCNAQGVLGVNRVILRYKFGVPVDNAGFRFCCPVSEEDIHRCSTTNRLHGRVVKGVGHLGHDEVMEAGCREFDPRPGMSFYFSPTRRLVRFSHLNMPSFKILNLFGILLSPWGSSNYRPYAPFLHEVASHVNNCHFGDYYIIILYIKELKTAVLYISAFVAVRAIPMHNLLFDFTVNYTHIVYILLQLYCTYTL